MSAHLITWFQNTASFAGFIFALGAFALFLGAIPILLLALFWLH
jgi:hypothetical protein